jgi:hypothetical protein
MPSARIAPESGRNTPSAKRPHASPGALPSHRQGPTSTDLDAPSLRGHQRRAVGPCWARVRSPTRRPRRRPRQRADVGRGCSEPNPATRIIKRVLTASGTYSPCGGNTRGSQTHGLAYVEANPRPQYRAHATRFGQRRLRFACLNRMQPVARQRSSVQPVAACAVRSGIAHRWHSVATLCMWLQHGACGCNTVCCAAASHLCVAQRQMSRRAAVATQMWAWAWTRLRCRCGLGWTSADVGWGWTLSQ